MTCICFMWKPPPLLVPLATFCFFCEFDLGTCWETTISPYADRQPKNIQVNTLSLNFYFCRSSFLEPSYSTYPYSS
ncbi:uncharacterized protein BX663DRAFT_491341 [Cokeromyces recurvatus]|uniref:uncharacterized protein n=1 Tax=Cokeromyces recurvatus TaxID=90255 RepID=UPI002220C80B|nr:uncharacterized protein BX663DRAFT_491341 [Cokeromyces recurvatus]KAI7907567.1 hypothetical protein BX663DRAFT_491341 [Cokeromyces recurvatus]